MSDPQVLRRHLNSPLVFLPDSALTSYAPTTVSMPFVRRHVTRRLKAAKAECDRELHRVTNSITIYFEARLRDADLDIDRDRLRAQDGDTDSQLGDLDSVSGTCRYNRRAGRPHTENALRLLKRSTVASRTASF